MIDELLLGPWTLREKMTERTRAEHLMWCKTRALEYVDSGDLQQALASMISDLGKHPDTAGEGAQGTAISLGVSQTAAGFLGTAREMRKFIEGFN